MSGPLPAFLRSLTRPASRLYALGIAARNRRFDRGIGVRKIDRPVISVGNVTTGGTGKTPMVACIARQLCEACHQPVIAMRGYRARPGEMSDEEAEYRATLHDIAVLANPDRIAALREFLPQHPQINCVLLDDGFQHRQLHRDIDLVLIDATAGTLHDELLPAGNLREPLDSLRRADAVIVTHAREVDSRLAQEIERWHDRIPIAWTNHVWSSLLVFRGENGTASTVGEHAVTLASSLQPVTWLREKRVVTMLGVGKPSSIMAQLEQAGAKVMADIPAGDHEHYDRAKLITARGLCDGADAFLVTHKDWVKVERLLPRLGGWNVPIVVPQLAIEFVDGEDALRSALLETVSGGEGAAR